MKTKFPWLLALSIALTPSLLFHGCATTSGPLKGVDAHGQKVYLGSPSIENTFAYKEFLKSNQTEADKQHYLFRRLKGAVDLQYFHDGVWYKPTEAYRAGMWLMRERYKKGEDTRIFIREHIGRSETTGQPHLVRYPDGSVQQGAYVLYNELDLLEQTTKAKTS